MQPCFPDNLTCPHCSSQDIVGNGVKYDQIFVDIPYQNQPAHIPLDHRQRYRCKSCKKTFWQKIEGIDERRNISLRCIAFIEKEAMDRSFLSVSRDVGLSEGTIRRIFCEYVARLEAAFHPKTPEVLSFDRINLIGKPHYFVTNFKTNGIIGFLDDTSKTAVETYLRKLENKGHIKKVVMDMNPELRGLVQDYLPDAKIVINPGHILTQTLQILENIRKETRKGLNAKDLRLLTNDKLIIRKSLDDLTGREKESFELWKQRFEKLALAYWHKEELRQFFQMDDSRKAAADIFERWQKNVLAEGLDEYFPVINSIFEWGDEVLTWFDSKHSGKGKHYGIVADMEKAINQRLKRGYSYEAIKARILSVKRVYPEDGISPGAVRWDIIKDNAISMNS